MWYNNKRGQIDNFSLLAIIFIGLFVIIGIIVLLVYIRVTDNGGIIIVEQQTEEEYVEETHINNYNSSIKIASWNLQIFGQSKASKPDTLNFYYKKLKDYDIIFIQEIRDSSNTSFETLCALFSNVTCRISKREGRTSSQEQIGLIYRNDLIIDQFYTLQDLTDVWERAPVKIVFNFSYQITFFNAHLKPDDVMNELRELELVVNKSYPTILLGDFNADCDYYNPSSDSAFDSWSWLINSDTTVSSNECVYDRIIVNDEIKDYVINYGVDKVGINTTYSDHYIIWVEVKV